MHVIGNAVGAIEYSESFRFSSGDAEFAVLACTAGGAPGADGGPLLVFDVLSKPGAYAQNRIYDIGAQGCRDARDVRRLAVRLLGEAYGYAE